MALTAQEQVWADWIKKIIPRHYFATQQTDELAAAFAKMYEDVRVEAVDLFAQTYILTATGGNPDWLQLHAQDRGTNRQDGETDGPLRDRLRSIEGAVSGPALLDAINDILEGAGFSRTAAIVELRTDKAFFLVNSEDTAVGGTFTALGGGTFQFTPTVPFEDPPRYSEDIFFSGAASAGNNGTYTILSLLDNGVIYTNGAGVAGADAVVTWRRKRKNLQGYNTDGFKDAFLSRGYRMGKSLQNAIIVILPYPSTASVQAAVTAMVQQRKGAGVVVLVERRLTP